MKSFLKFTLASLIGTFIALFLVFIVMLGSMIGSLSKEMGKQPVPKVKDNSILDLNFDIPITDKPVTMPFDFSFSSLTGVFEKKSITLRSLL